jgi:hypothetical protein
MFQPFFWVVHTEIQSPAIASMPSLLLGSQSVDLDIFSPCLGEFFINTYIAGMKPRGIDNFLFNAPLGLGSSFAVGFNAPPAAAVRISDAGKKWRQAPLFLESLLNLSFVADSF